MQFSCLRKDRLRVRSIGVRTALEQNGESSSFLLRILNLCLVPKVHLGTHLSAKLRFV